MICPKCGTPGKPDALFCENCGTRLIAAPENTDQPADNTVAAPETGSTYPFNTYVPPVPPPPIQTGTAVPVQAEQPGGKKSKTRPAVIAAAAVLLVAGIAVGLLFGLGILPTGAGKDNPRESTGEAQSTGEASTPEDATNAAALLPEDLAVTYGKESLGAFYAAQYHYYDPYSYDYMFDEDVSPQQRADGAFKELEEVYCFYLQAKKAGLSLSDEYRAAAESEMSEYKEEAEAAGIKNFDAYLEQVFGTPIVNENTLRAFLEMYTLCLQYKNERYDAELAGVTDKMINEKLGSGDGYNVVDLRLLGIRNENDAQKKAEEMLSRVTDEASFISLCREYCSEDQKDVFDDPTASLATHIKRYAIASNIGEDLAAWLFSEERAAGDKRVYVTENYVYVMMVKEPAYLEDDPLVSARHILVSYEGIITSGAYDEAGNADQEGIPDSDAVNVAAYTKAREIFDEYLSGDRTEEAFAALANKYSDDTASLDDGSGSVGGGLYEDIEKGRFVEPFEQWVYDPVRMPGDVDVIQTTYGWHVMYFVSRHAEPEWKESIRNELGGEAYRAWVEQGKNAFKGSLQKGEAYNDLCAALYGAYQKSSGK